MFRKHRRIQTNPRRRHRLGGRDNCPNERMEDKDIHRKNLPPSQEDRIRQHDLFNDLVQTGEERLFFRQSFFVGNIQNLLPNDKKADYYRGSPSHNGLYMVRHNRNAETYITRTAMLYSRGTDPKA